MRRAASLPWLVPIFWCTACVAPPPVHIDAAHGRVRAHTHSEALATAELLDDLHRRVRETLPATDGEPVEVWVQDELRIFWWVSPAPEVNAINYRPWRRLHLERDSNSLAEDLSHELVHLLIDRSWRAIPPAIEEGLADHVSEALTIGSGKRIRAFRLIDALTALGPLEVCFRLPATNELVSFRSDPTGQSLDPAQVFDGLISELSPHSHSGEKQALYGLGYLAVDRIVDRIGYEGLHSLCVDAAERGLAFVPPEELATAAELEGGAKTWRRAILSGLGTSELAVLAEHDHELLAHLLHRAFHERYGETSGVAFLENEHPLWSFEAGGIEVSLADVPGMRDALRSVWPDMATPVAPRAVANALSGP